MKSTAALHPEVPAPDPAIADGLAGWLPELAEGDPAAHHRLAAGAPRRLGELVFDADPSRENQVAQALADASRSGRKIGEVLVERGVITAAERDTMLEFQRHQRGEAPTEDRFRLGRILVSLGHITDEELVEALLRQRASGRPLGEELVAQGQISHEVLQVALYTQRQLVIAALLAALAMVSPGAVTPVEAAQKATQSLDLRITIPAVMRMKVLHQPATIEVTPQDVERGYVEVTSGSLLQVTANIGWQLSFATQGGIASSAQVRGLPGNVVVGPEGGTVTGLRPMRHATVFDLSYRFVLAPGVAPGTYPWPVMILANAA